jgi:predicted metal-dependent hydrolase
MNLLFQGSFPIQIFRRRRQKHLHLYVRPSGEIHLTAGLRVTPLQIQAFLKERESWIHSTYQKVMARQKASAHWQARDGGVVPYLGRDFRVRVVWVKKKGGLSVYSQNGELIVVCIPHGTQKTIWTDATTNMEFPTEVDSGINKHGTLLELGPRNRNTQANDTEIAQAILSFYHRQARLIFTARLNHYSERMALKPPKIRMALQKSRWGSCSSQGTISLNWGLVLAPLNIVDYVIVHELAHLKYFDHSPQFWRLVETQFPDHRGAKLWLREHAPAFEFLHNLKIGRDSQA